MRAYNFGVVDVAGILEGLPQQNLGEQKTSKIQRDFW